MVLSWIQLLKEKAKLGVGPASKPGPASNLPSDNFTCFFKKKLG